MNAKAVVSVHVCCGEFSRANTTFEQMEFDTDDEAREFYKTLSLGQDYNNGKIIGYSIHLRKVPA